MTSGSDVVANEIMISVVDLADSIFEQPPASGPIYGPVTPITTADLTTGDVGGTGVFDLLMKSLVAHLQVEYKANRISGAEYTKAYIGIVGAALSTSAQFLLGKDQAYWGSVMAQLQAQQAEIERTQARVLLATSRANYALTKLKLATEDATYGNLVLQGEGIAFTNEFILPLQKSLLSEQVEVQRAQTMNTRLDGTVIVGTLGKQKDLYTQQITSYQRDAETKAAKMWIDAWITQKTLDEGLLAPTNFANAQIDLVLTKLRTNLALN